MGFLSRETLLSHAVPLPTERVDIPELGGYVFVRVMTGAEKDRWEILTDKERATNDGYCPNIRALLVAFTCCDADGGRMFSVEEAEALGEQSAIVLERIFIAARSLNKMSAEEVADLTKNSVTAPDAVSGSASPESLVGAVSANGRLS